MMITVFTPAYNRAHLLPRLFESLCKQTYKDFEWVIVDDGSVDDTRSVVEQFSQYSTLNTNTIRYFYQENGGKHRAINRGVKEARGELFFIADSDDWLPVDSLEIVAKYYNDIKNNKKFAAVVGIDAFSDGHLITGSASFDTLDCTEIDFRNRYHMRGDMKEVFRTSVLKEIPFPEINGEMFCPEDLVWHRIAKKYKFRYFNKVIYNVEYQPTGLSARLRKLRMDSPIASVIHYAEYNDFKLPINQKIRNAINYWRFWYCLSNNKKEMKEIPHISWVWLWTKPLGWLMHINDLRITK